MAGSWIKEQIMRLDKDSLLLYAITDRRWLAGESLASAVERAIRGGVTCLQLREKDMDEQQFCEEALEIKKICEKYHVPLIINDNVKVALAVDADGVHVGQSDMEAGNVRKLLGPDKIIGVTAKTVEQALRAQASGADYLGVGAVFHTGSKTDAKEITHETLREICGAVSIPVAAIGGITAENVLELSGTGISGIAVISAVFAEKDVEEAARILRGKVSQLAEIMHTALTIAGSDCSGGAGIQADIKTMLAHGVYAMSAVTALTAQNTTGVYGIQTVDPAFLKKQLDCVFTDIFPDAVKVGMAANAELIHVIAEQLKRYKARNIVVDPVMISTSGSALLREDAADALQRELFPLATVVTPNLLEAEVLSGRKISTPEDMEAAAAAIHVRYGCSVLCKGGHRVSDANDLLYTNGEFVWFAQEHIDNPNSHGTGCTLSSAIASNLAKGIELTEAVRLAKEYITVSLKAMLDLGKGSGPLDHGAVFRGTESQWKTLF